MTSAVKAKMDDTGITDKAKSAGGFVYDTGAAGVGYVSSAIDSNPTLASAKTAAATGVGQAASYMGSLWSGGLAALSLGGAAAQ